MGLANNHAISYIELVSLGSISATIVTPLEVFNLTVRKKSPSIVLVHNHPSGQLEPSASDKALTEQIIAGGKILEIGVLGDLIISESGYYSFAQHQLL